MTNTRKKTRRPITIAGVFALVLTGIATGVLACDVPVFRYALQYWEPDPYIVRITHAGSLDGEAKIAADRLVQAAQDEQQSANIIIRFIDESTDNGSRDHDRAARVMIDPPNPNPRSSENHTALFVAPLTEQTVRQILDSPVRRETARRLIDGDSAVWIMLESDRPERNLAARTMLERELRFMEKMLRLPRETQEAQSAPDPLEPDPNPVRISFSILSLNPDDPDEAFFIACLKHNLRAGTDPDPHEPIVFPVFGRGRRLDALYGHRLNPSEIHAACRFLVGACSCEAKAQNPGWDLLMTADWKSGFSDSLLDVIDLPPLVGLSEMATAAATPPDNRDQNQPTISVQDENELDPIDNRSLRHDTLIRNMILLIGLLILGVFLATLYILRKP